MPDLPVPRASPRRFTEPVTMLKILAHLPQASHVSLSPQIGPEVSTLTKWLVRLCVASSVLGFLAAVITPIVVWRTLQNFIDDERQAFVAANDPQRLASFETLVQTSHQFTIVLAGLCLVSAALCIGAAVLLRRARLNSNPNG